MAVMCGMTAEAQQLLNGKWNDTTITDLPPICSASYNNGEKAKKLSNLICNKILVPRYDASGSSGAPGSAAEEKGMYDELMAKLQKYHLSLQQWDKGSATRYASLCVQLRAERDAGVHARLQATLVDEQQQQEEGQHLDDQFMMEGGNE